MNMKTFLLIYCLLILSGYLAIVAVTEYHITVIANYTFTDVWQVGNETVATHTTVFAKDIYLYKTDYLEQTVILAHGTNASQVIQAALDMTGLIVIHRGPYDLDVGLFLRSNSTIFGGIFLMPTNNDYAFSAIDIMNVVISNIIIQGRGARS